MGKNFGKVFPFVGLGLRGVGENQGLVHFKLFGWGGMTIFVVVKVRLVELGKLFFIGASGIRQIRC